MMTFKQFSEKIEAIPASTSWYRYLADLSEARGRQELFTRQAPLLNGMGAGKRNPSFDLNFV